MEITHTNHCKTRAAAHQEWMEKYPNHCPECEGAGERETTDSVDYGSTTVSLVGNEPCTCLENGACPRCGEQWLTDVNFEYNAEHSVPCPFCGWEWGRGETDRAPYFDCSCWENQIPDEFPDYPELVPTSEFWPDME